MVLAAISYIRSREIKIELNPKIQDNEIFHILFAILMPIIAICGVLLLNNYNNNFLNLLLFSLIPIYLVIITLNNKKIPNRLYPYILFSIGLSLLLSYALRSEYIVFGADTDWEYYLFNQTIANQFWANFTHVTYDSCISISILPAIYYSFLKIPAAFLFRILYPLLFSIAPLIVYFTARKYLDDHYAFLASFFFMSFYQFYSTNNRVDIALIFFALTILTMFHRNISIYYKRILIILFLASCVLSHYSTAFITLFMLFLSFVLILMFDDLPKWLIRFKTVNSILNNQNVRKNRIVGFLEKNTKIKLNLDKEPNKTINKSHMLTYTLIVLFFSIIFLWEAYIMQAPFDDALVFMSRGVNTMKDFLLFEVGNGVLRFATGKASYLGIPGRIELILSWTIIAVTLFGVLSAVLNKITIIKSFNEISSYLKNLDSEFLAISIVGSFILMVSFIMPYISSGYNILRTYFHVLFLLNVFFVVGVVFISELIKGKFNIKMKSFASCLLLLLIVPYFLCTTGVMYQLFDVPRSITFNSHGKEYDDIFIHVQEIKGAEWLGKYRAQNKSVNTDYLGRMRVIIGGLVTPYLTTVNNNITKDYNNSYIYLRYYNVREGKVLIADLAGTTERKDLKDYKYIINGSDKLYDNGGSQIWL